MTDEELVERFVSSDDREALQELVSRYSDKLRRLLYSMLGADLDRVQEAEQEVYVKLVERVDRFRGASSFSTFFYALARNRVLDIMRLSRRRLGRDTVLAFPDKAASLLPGPAERLERETDAALLRSAMTILSPSDRFLLYMKDAEGESIADLAAVTGQREGTIKSRLSRARSRLKRHLEVCGYER